MVCRSCQFLEMQGLPSVSLYNMYIILFIVVMFALQMSKKNSPQVPSKLKPSQKKVSADPKKKQSSSVEAILIVEKEHVNHLNLFLLEQYLLKLRNNVLLKNLFMPLLILLILLVTLSLTILNILIPLRTILLLLNLLQKPTTLPKALKISPRRTLMSFAT